MVSRAHLENLLAPSLIKEDGAPWTQDAHDLNLDSQ